jgi:hypothetical protein
LERLSRRLNLASSSAYFSSRTFVSSLNFMEAVDTV